MKNKEQRFSRILTLFFTGVAILVAINIFVKDIKNFRYYDMDAKTAITECTDFENARMSFERTRYSPEGELQARDITYIFLCGIQQAETFEIKTSEVQTINLNKNFGEVKIVFVQQDNDSFYSFALAEGDNKYDLEKGVYDVYIIGKYFSGKISFEIINL